MSSESAPLLRSKSEDAREIPVLDKNDLLTSSLILLRDCSLGLINATLTIPCMYGYCAIIFSHSAFAPFVPILNKSLLLSSVVFQVCFSLMSVMPFAIGQVQDAGLVFLCSIATSIATYVHNSGFDDVDLTSLHELNPYSDMSLRSMEYASTVASTSVVCIGICTALLGIALIGMGRFGLSKMVSYLPFAVIGGYLAFIGLICSFAALSLSVGASVTSVAQWPALMTVDRIIHIVPGLVGGLVLYYIARYIKHPAALPLAMISMPVIFFGITSAFGISLEQARSTGWIAQATPSIGPTAVFTDLFDFSKVQWSAMPAQLPQWIAMTFVVAFSSCLDVAAIEIDLGRSLDMNSELSMIGWSNLASGMLGGYTGSYIFSQTIFTCRAKSATRLVGWMVAISELGVFLLPTDVMSFVPRFFFAATLFFIAFDLMFEWLVQVYTHGKVSLAEHLVSIVTFLAMVVYGLEWGLAIGILSAGVHFIYLYIVSSRTIINDGRSMVELPHSVRSELNTAKSTKGIRVVELSGVVFFGSSLSMLETAKQNMLVTATAGHHNSLVSLAEMEQMAKNQSKSRHDRESWWDRFCDQFSSQVDAPPLEAGMGTGDDSNSIRTTPVMAPTPRHFGNTPSVAVTPEIERKLRYDGDEHLHTRLHPLRLTTSPSGIHLADTVLPDVPTQALVVNFTNVINVDTTAVRSCFLILSHLAKSHNIDLVYAGVQPQIQYLCRNSGVFIEPTSTIATTHAANMSLAKTVSSSPSHYDAELGIVRLNGLTPAKLFDLPDDLPCLNSPWGTICVTNDLQTGLRWCEARTVFKRD